MDEKRMSIVGHLTDLYKTVIWCVIACVIGFIIAFIKTNAISEYLLAPAPFEVFNVYEPTESFVTKVRIAFYVGLVLASPAMAVFISRFVAPGLTRQERLWIPVMVLCSAALFVISAVMVYTLILPTVLNFFSAMKPDIIETGISYKLYITFIMSFLMAFGAALQFPFVLALLIVTGIVDADALAKRRIYVIGAIAALGVVISFGVDIITQLMFFVPIYILFELSLAIGRALRKMIIRRRNNTVRG
ncbi:MAG: twin-arginine translocase subunit TatC [Clostridiales bacterium]|nr:twin-arginine translocase subunit TatC [Clostridiales bacterium]